jgi:hypothetical protein
MSKRIRPSEDNGFLESHISLLRTSLRHWTGRDLVPPSMNGKEAARFVFNAPFAVVSHDTAKDPLFNYANQTALNLFAMDWEGFTTLPSRLSAEEANQADRERHLAEVSGQGFIDSYSGIRIGRHGRRFFIKDVLIWNLLDVRHGIFLGQAAMFKSWEFL